MADMKMAKRLIEYRKSIRKFYVDRFLHDPYLTGEPVPGELVGDTTRKEIMRARVSGLMDAIEEVGTLEIACFFIETLRDRYDDEVDEETDLYGAVFWELEKEAR